MHDITSEFGIWFLLLSLFVPRITIFFWWICGALPPHTTPFVANMFASFFVPRILILVWIYGTMGFNAWFWIHLVALFIAWGCSILRGISAQTKN